MSSAKWQTVNGVRYSTGICQSHTEGIKDCDGPEYTVVDRVRRRKGGQQQIERKAEVGDSWMILRGKGPDPGGVSFLAANDWEGVVDGYIHKNGEKGWGYYRTSPPPAGEKETFVHEGKVWETVKELTIEEAITLQKKSSKDARGFS